MLKNGRFHWWAPQWPAGLLLIAWSVPTALCAQAPAVGAEPALSADGIQARIKEVEENKDLKKELKKKLLDTWREALAQLKSAEEWAAKAEAYEKARQEAPLRLELMKNELKRAVAEPVVQAPADASLQQLEQLAAQASAELSNERKAREALEEDAKQRTARRAEVPKLAPAAQQRLKEVKEQLASKPAADEPAELAQARRAVLRLRMKAVQQELNALEKEIHSYDARGDLLSARLDLAARKVTAAEKKLAAVQALVTARRRQEEAAAARQAEEARRIAARSHQAVQPIAEENAKLAEKRTGPAGVPSRIENASKLLQQAQERLVKLKDAQRRAKQKIEVAGLTRAMALLLRKERRDLPDVREIKRRMKARQDEIAEAQFQPIELRERRRALADLDGRVQALMASLPEDMAKAERADVEAAARELLESQRTLIDALIADYDTYFTKLIDLDGAERQLVDAAQAFATYIDERVLWLRSAAPLRPSDLPKAWEAARWLVAPSRWAEAGELFARDLRDNAALYLMLAIALVVLMATRRRARSQLEQLQALVAQPDTDGFGHTLKAMVLTALLALPPPLVIGVVAFRLRAVSETSIFASAISDGLMAVFAVFLALALLRAVCVPKGLGEAHLLWRPDGPPALRRQLRWAVLAGLPIVFLWTVLHAQPQEEWRDSLARMLFVVGMGVVALLDHQVLRPSGAVMQSIIVRRRDGWLYRFRFVLYALGVAGPIALAAMAVAGYYYSAEELERRLRTTALLLVCLGFVHELLARALHVVRRRRAFKKAKTSPDAAAVEKGRQRGTELYIMSQQAQRLIRGALTVALVIGIWITWSDALPALGIIKQVRLWPTTVQEVRTVVGADGVEQTETLEKPGYITLADLAVGCIVVAMTLVAVRNIPGLLEFSVLHYLPIDRGVRFAITSILRYTLIVVGTVLALSTVGVRWAHVQWLVAAMTVGLGFGLQEIFANFVSGIIILFERPIRVGDTVTVGDVTGTVTQIRIRATTITDWDMKELVVPNKTFITGELINWSLSDPVLRMRFTVGIAYGSDTALAHKTLLEVAKANPIALDDPAPSVVFMAFGDSALELELRLFVPGMERYWDACDEINAAIDQAFREAGIEIAFPQRDVHVRSIEAALPVPPPAPGKHERE